MMRSFSALSPFFPLFSGEDTSPSAVSRRASSLLVGASSFPSLHLLFLLLTFVGGGSSPVLAQGLFEEAIRGEQQPTSQPTSRPTSQPLSQTGSPPQAIPTTGSPVIGSRGFQLHGFVRGLLYLGKEAGQDKGQAKAAYAQAALKLRARLGALGGAYGELRLGAGLFSGEELQVLPELREAYIDAYLGPLDLRLGRQIIAWGRADLLNPTDNLTPRNMGVRSPAEEDRRLGNWALRATLNFSPLRWEFIWIPFYAPTLLPPLQFPGPITLATAEYPGPDLAHSTLATRLNVIFPAIEFSFSYLYGYSTTPGIAFKKVVLKNNEPAVTAAFTTYQHHVAGLDFATSLASLGLRGEAAFRYPFHAEDTVYLPSPDLYYVLGLDREFWGALTIILQYSGRYVFGWSERDPPTSTAEDPSKRAVQNKVLRKLFDINRAISGQTNQLQHTITLRLGLKLLQETLTIDLLGLYTLTTEEWLLRTRISYAITDGLQISAGGELYLGPEESTLFGLISEHQSAAFLSLRGSF